MTIIMSLFSSDTFFKVKKKIRVPDDRYGFTMQKIIYKKSKIIIEK